jgi:hypothetical protein
VPCQKLSLCGLRPAVIFFSFLFVFFFFFIEASVLSPCAQTETASIRGSVTDSRGALISNATVRLANIDRGSVRQVMTEKDGSYYLSDVRPGRYRLEVEKSGFKPLHLTEITVNVQDNLEQNCKLEVGPASETITVEANALNVNTTDATVSTVVDRHFAEELPLNGRSFQTLIMLAPGVAVTSTAFDDQGQFSVNGQRADANYFTVDGVSANFGVTGFLAMVQSASGALPASSAVGGTNSLVSVDAMQEFRVQTSSFAPEFGRTPGGQVAIVTRSGTNDFHGTLFEYFRNGALDANDWFANFNHLPKPDEKQNDFGEVLGGPIIKDKTFFFFSYEGLRLRQPATTETVVPDAASRQQAPPGVQPFLNAYPVANGTELGPGLAQFNASFSNPSSVDAYSLRIDHVVNSDVSLFGRYNYSSSSQSQRGPFAGFVDLSTTESFAPSVHTLTVGATQLIRPEISNDVRANYSNQRVKITASLDSFGGAVPVPGSLVFPSGFSSNNGLFQGVILGSGELSEGNLGTDEQRQLNFADNFSVKSGHHQIKFGTDYRWLAPFSSPHVYAQLAEFAGVTASRGGVLSGSAAIAFSEAFQGDALLSQNFSFYGQDSWKITPRITATYGLRWEINPPLKGKNLQNDPFTVLGFSDLATLTLAPRGTPLYQTTYGNVAPRLGIAYQLNAGPNWLSVFRAGAGIFYDLGQGSLGGVSSFFPYSAVKSIPLAPFPLSPQNAAPPTLTTNPPVGTIVLANPGLKLPRTYQWNVALEQSIGRDQNVSLTYVGALGRDLLRVTNLVGVNPNFAFIALTDNSATSDYNALQLKYQRQLSHGLQALASYTFSHSIDNASTDAIANDLNTPSVLANPNIDRGDSDFDIRHSFTAGLTYDLPPPGSQPIVHAIASGWSLDTFTFARSATPVDIVAPIFVAGGTELSPRPNVVPGVPMILFGTQFPGGTAFNGAAFSIPAAGTQGDARRNVLRGFGAWQLDVALQRQFHLTDRLALRFRSEFFNIFNHPNFGNPNNVLNSPLFGQSTQSLANGLGSGGPNGGFSPLYQIGGPRSIQLALKLQF